jgi:hypothetical protein
MQLLQVRGGSKTAHANVLDEFVQLAAMEIVESNGNGIKLKTESDMDKRGRSELRKTGQDGYSSFFMCSDTLESGRISIKRMTKNERFKTKGA